MKTKTPSGDARSGLPRPRLFDSTFFSPPISSLQKNRGRSRGGDVERKRGWKRSSSPAADKSYCTIFLLFVLYLDAVPFMHHVQHTTLHAASAQRSGLYNIMHWREEEESPLPPAPSFILQPAAEASSSSYPSPPSLVPPRSSFCFHLPRAKKTS